MYKKCWGWRAERGGLVILPHYTVAKDVATPAKVLLNARFEYEAKRNCLLHPYPRTTVQLPFIVTGFVEFSALVTWLINGLVCKTFKLVIIYCKEMFQVQINCIPLELNRSSQSSMNRLKGFTFIITKHILTHIRSLWSDCFDSNLVELLAPSPASVSRSTFLYISYWNSLELKRAIGCSKSFHNLCVIFSSSFRNRTVTWKRRVSCMEHTITALKVMGSRHASGGILSVHPRVNWLMSSVRPPKSKNEEMYTLQCHGSGGHSFKTCFLTLI